MITKSARPPAGIQSKGIFTAFADDAWRHPPFSTPATIARRRVLFEQGERADRVFLVLDGLIKTYRARAKDRVQILGLASAGDVLGTEALTRSTYHESAAALARSIVVSCPRSDFVPFLQEHPEVAVRLIQMLSSVNREIQALLCDLGTKRALSRVASCLLLLLRKQSDGAPDADRVTLPVSRQEMGSLLGLSPETVSRQLRDLSSDRVIRLERRRLSILDLDHLHAIADA